MMIPQNSKPIEVREVWNDNLEGEFKLIRDIVDDYPYIGMDTEFPGVILRTGNKYTSLKANVDHLKLIQLGLTFTDEKGNLPTCGTDKQCFWQFNFSEFDPNVDCYNKNSIDMLRNEAGIDFEKFKEKGVSAFDFSELLKSSGAVLNGDIQWLTFSGGSDFGYLLKLLTGNNLPNTEKEFNEKLKIFFPVIFDTKCLMRDIAVDGIYGGLKTVAELLNLKRVGVAHNAGSDSLLTCRIFLRLKEKYFRGSVPKTYTGKIEWYH